jgi:aflatoxin B1 aldehyde reductase
MHMYKRTAETVGSLLCGGDVMIGNEQKPKRNQHSIFREENTFDIIIVIIMSAHPTLHFGTSLFGSQNSPALTSESYCSALLDDVHSADIWQIDTAARYPPENSGASERMLGAVGAATGKGFRVNTKVLFSGHDSDGTLGLEAVRESVRISRERLLGDMGAEDEEEEEEEEEEKKKKKKLGILYAHCPDGKTPLEEQARAMSEQVEKGYCEQVRRLLHL